MNNMSNINGIHPSSSSMSDNQINDTAKRRSSTSDHSLTSINKRFKSKNAVLIPVNETRSMKSFNKKQKTIDANKNRLIHSDSNNNNNSTKKIKQYSHSDTEHSQETPIDYCNTCGACYDEMISCDTCSATFHLFCINPSLSKEDISKGCYSCESCRTITKTQDDLINKDQQEKLILPFSFVPKKNLHMNGFNKNHSTLGQIKIPTASNGRSLVQPSGEIKFRATSSNNNKSKYSSSTSNLKRKRIDSSSPPPSSINPVKSPNTQLEILHRLFLSCQPEEFHGPSLLLNDSIYSPIQKNCFICRKSSVKQGPSIHCDYCPLTYHLDCLTPPIISLPLSDKKWMCPNHVEPILDCYLSQKKTSSSTERTKIYQQCSPIEQNTLIQDFTNIKQTNDYLLSNTINNHRLERIDISQIPKSIEEFYVKANTEQKQISEIKINDYQEENYVQTALSPDESSSAYDPCIWDILQAILDHIVNDHSYTFDDSSIETNHLTKSPSKNKCNTLDTIDTLLDALNEPKCTQNQTNDLITTVEQKFLPASLTNSFSFLIDLSQFRLSHAALIHLRSQQIIYIRKHVIWFGSSSLNDICLANFNHSSSSCQYITDRHACLYYDQKHNLFELLNYSEYGTIVNDLSYGFTSPLDNDNKQENGTCFCLTQPSYHSTWDGPAQIEQGTVIKIGCHEFLFYRHIVR